MTAPDPRLGEIEGRLAKVSPGPWESSQGANADGKKLATTGAEKAAFLALSVNDNESPLWLVVSPEVIPAATGDGPKARANAEFIAAAPADVAYLLAELRKAQDKLAAVSRIVNQPDWEGFPPFRVDAEPIRAAVAAATGGGK